MRDLLRQAGEVFFGLHIHAAQGHPFSLGLQDTDGLLIYEEEVGRSIAKL